MAWDCKRSHLQALRPFLRPESLETSCIPSGHLVHPVGPENIPENMDQLVVRPGVGREWQCNPAVARVSQRTLEECHGRHGRRCKAKDLAVLGEILAFSAQNRTLK